MSRMNRKVVDIEGANPSENTKVIMYDPHGTERNQLWYFDEQGIIRSALNDMVFFSEHGAAIFVLNLDFNFQVNG